MKMPDILSIRGKKSLKKAVFFTIFTQLAGWFSFICSMVLVYTLLSKHSEHRIIAVFFVGLMLMLVETLLIKAQYRASNIPAYEENERLRMDIASRLCDLPMAYYGDRTLSDVTGVLLDDCSKVEGMLSHLLPSYYAGLVTIPAAFIVLLFFDVRLAIATFLTVPLSIGAQVLSLRIQGRLVDDHLLTKRIAASKMQEYVEGMPQIRANVQGGEKCSELADALAKWKRDSLKMEISSGVFTAGADVVLQLGIGIVVFVSAMLLKNRTLEPFVMILFFSAALSIYIPVSGQIVRLPNLIYIRQSLQRIKELLNQALITGKEKPEIEHYQITFSNVDFSYTNSKVLEHISFSADEGKVTAIVGPSGAGKSTITNLIARFWDADTGMICLDGHNISNMDPRYYSRFISFVFQDVVLFQDTVYQNILVGNPSATPEAVYEAARLARCEEFVQRLPDGYDTVLMENGKSLSGGERQRIAIARAILKNAPIVVLDEATSALDTMNEYYIHQALSELVRGKTVIIVAHTLRNIMNAHKIVVLEDGRIKEQGNHSTLMDLNGRYAGLLQIQKEAMGWSVGIIS